MGKFTQRRADLKRSRSADSKRAMEHWRLAFAGLPKTKAAALGKGQAASKITSRTDNSTAAPSRVKRGQQ